MARVVQLDLTVPEGGTDALVETLTEAFEVYEAGDGLTMALFVDRDDPTRFVELAQYASADAEARDAARMAADDEVRAALARWRACLAGPPGVRHLVRVRIGRPAAQVVRLDAAQILEVWRARWGLPIVSRWRVYGEADAADAGGVGLSGPRGLCAAVTWARDGDAAELVTVDAWPAGRGRGRQVMAAAEAALAAQGVKTLRLATTNDNVAALAFYQRCGFRLVEVVVDGIDRSLKPEIPETGAGGVPLRDWWVLVKHLSR